MLNAKDIDSLFTNNLEFRLRCLLFSSNSYISLKIGFNLLVELDWLVPCAGLRRNVARPFFKSSITASKPENK